MLDLSGLMPEKRDRIKRVSCGCVTVLSIFAPALPVCTVMTPSHQNKAGCTNIGMVWVCVGAWSCGRVCVDVPGCRYMPCVDRQAPSSSTQAAWPGLASDLYSPGSGPPQYMHVAVRSIWPACPITASPNNWWTQAHINMHADAHLLCKV